MKEYDSIYQSTYFEEATPHQNTREPNINHDLVKAGDIATRKKIINSKER